MSIGKDEKAMEKNLTGTTVKNYLSCQSWQCGESPQSRASSGMSNKGDGVGCMGIAEFHPTAINLVNAPS